MNSMYKYGKNTQNGIALRTMTTPTRTRQCMNMRNTGTCRFGDKCNFSHVREKSKLPCWYYNTPRGCAKDAEECTFAHVKSPGMRKPVYLQKPCTQYHLGTCTRVGCTFDHEPLLLDEWQTHFPGKPFPAVEDKSLEEVYSHLSVKSPHLNHAVGMQGDMGIAAPHHLLSSPPTAESCVTVIPKDPAIPFGHLGSAAAPQPKGVWGKGVSDIVKAPPSAELQAKLESEKRAREKERQRALREEQRRIRASRPRDPNSWADVSSDTESEDAEDDNNNNRYIQTDSLSTSTDSYLR